VPARTICATAARNGASPGPSDGLWSPAGALTTAPAGGEAQLIDALGVWGAGVPPPEASADDPTTAAATTIPVTAPVTGARHLPAENDMCSSDLDRAAPIAARFAEHPSRS
jgi:hypothetical protein